MPEPCDVGAPLPLQPSWSNCKEVSGHAQPRPEPVPDGPHKHLECTLPYPWREGERGVTRRYSGNDLMRRLSHQGPSRPEPGVRHHGCKPRAALRCLGRSQERRFDPGPYWRRLSYQPHQLGDRSPGREVPRRTPDGSERDPDGRDWQHSAKHASGQRGIKKSRHGDPFLGLLQRLQRANATFSPSASTQDAPAPERVSVQTALSSVSGRGHGADLAHDPLAHAHGWG
jgi:hypothetical protein